MAIALFFTGCSFNQQTYVTDVNARAWSIPATVTIPNTDTTALHDLYIFVRSNDHFTTDSLTLQVAFRTPDSIRFEDRIFATLSRSHSPAATAQETRIPYRTRIRLVHSGNYRVTFTPAIPVAGIESVGIHIEKSN